MALMVKNKKSGKYRECMDLKRNGQARKVDLKWKKYLNINNCSIEDVDPDEFVRWVYGEAMKHRNPIYKSMASWGITVQADLISQVKTPSEFNSLIGSTISENIQ